MRGCSLFSFLLKSILTLKQNLAKPITAPLMQNGKLEAFKPHQVESSTVECLRTFLTING